MSRLGYIENSYNKPFAVAVANTYSSIVMENVNSLPSNMMIIASNVDEDGNDAGTYSLIVTDYNGSPIRLTYTLSEGNGLHYSQEDDAVSLDIDNDTIIYDEEKGLTINLLSHLNKAMAINEDKLYIDNTQLPISSTSTLGISSIDNNTIKSDDGMIYVDTSKLMFANNSTKQYGIVIGDNNTIKIENGKITFNLDSLRAASNEEYGIVRSDGYTIEANNGILSVITENLDKATMSDYGIARIDGSTLIRDNENNITVNEQNLDIARPDRYGVSKIDSNTLEINNGVVSIKEYNNIMSLFGKYKKLYDDFKKKLEGYRDYLSNGNVLLRNKNILLFAVNETSTIELDKPNTDEEVINMPLQTVTVVFDVITTCDFIFNIDFEEGTNEFPLVDILEVNYNDEISYDKVQALDPKTTYPSTKGELKKLIVKFSAKNFRNSVKGEYIVTSINMTLSSAEDHNKNLTQKYSIVRYNSAYVPDNGTAEMEEFYVLVTNSVRWGMHR